MLANLTCATRPVRSRRVRLLSTPAHLGSVRLGLIALGLAGATALGAHPAQAQLLDQYLPTSIPGYDTNIGVTVASRIRPEYEYPGIRVGNFLINPQVSQGIGYDDNVFGQSSARGSGYEATHASASAVSNWSNAALGVQGSVDDTRYFSVPKLNSTNGAVSIGGSYNFGRDQATLGYSHLFQHELPTDIGVGGGVNVPVAYDVDDFRASYLITGARANLTPAFEYERFRFQNATQNGLTLNETYRNRDVAQGSLTGQYEMAAQQNLVAVVRGTNTHYVSTQPGFITSDSNAVTALVGIDFATTAVIRYRALVGYEFKSNNNKAVSNQGSPVFEGGVVWTPTGLTTVTGTVLRRIEDAAEEDTVGYTLTSANLAVDHELFQNILLNGHAQYQRADYAGNGGTQNLYSTGASVSWLLNRYMRLSATYDFYKSNATFGDYTRNITMLRLTVGAF